MAKYFAHTARDFVAIYDELPKAAREFLDDLAKAPATAVFTALGLDTGKPLPSWKGAAQESEQFDLTDPAGVFAYAEEEAVTMRADYYPPADASKIQWIKLNGEGFSLNVRYNTYGRLVVDLEYYVKEGRGGWTNTRGVLPFEGGYWIAEQVNEAIQEELGENVTLNPEEFSQLVLDAYANAARAA